MSWSVIEARRSFFVAALSTFTPYCFSAFSLPDTPASTACSAPVRSWPVALAKSVTSGSSRSTASAFSPYCRARVWACCTASSEKIV